MVHIPAPAKLSSGVVFFLDSGLQSIPVVEFSLLFSQERVMKCFVVFQSIASWQKLSGISMKPRYALRILRYTKLVSAEYDNIERLRVSLARRIAGAAEGSAIKIEPNTPEAKEFAERFNEILNVDVDLVPLRMSLDEIVNNLDGKEDSLTVADLAVLEPFFYEEIDLPKPDGDCSE